MADSIQGAMREAFAEVSQDVRPVGSSADTRPTEPITETPDGIRPADSKYISEDAAEVTAPPSTETPSIQPEKKAPEHIPYDRFQEVIRERNEARQRVEEVQKYYATLDPRQKAILENPSLLQDPVRLNAFLYGEQQTQKETVPDFNAIDDPYEREIAMREYQIRKDFEEQQKPIVEKLKSFEDLMAREQEIRLVQEGNQILAAERSEVLSRPEFAGVAEAERAAILEDIHRVAMRYQGAIPLTEAYRLSPHYDRLMERHITAKALGIQQAKRQTTSSGSISSGGGNPAPASVNSIGEAYNLAVQRATTG